MEDTKPKPEETEEDAPRRRARAPRPITMLSGTGGWRFAIKPPTIPPNPPVNFPNDLWPRACVILADGVTKFPDREQQLPELCRYYISGMMPIYCAAVQDGTMTAGAVLQENLGGMQDLLR